MRKKTIIFLFSGLLLVAVFALAFAVPGLAMDVFAAGESGNAVSQGDLIVEVPQVTSADLVEDMIIVSPENLPEGVSPSVPGYNPDRDGSYEGPSGYELFYDYGFADRYGRLDYALPGYSDTQRFDLANAYIKYARFPRYEEPYEVRVSCVNEETGETEYQYITVSPDSEEFLRVMSFEEFMAGYEDFVATGEGGIEEYLTALLDQPIPDEVLAQIGTAP